MVRWAMAGALCVVGALGCNEIAGIKDPVGGEGGTPAVVAGVERFYGRWKSTDGAITLTNCRLASSLTMQTGSLDLAKGPANSLLFITDKCSLNTTVVGDTASFDPGQSCVLRGDTSTSTPTLTVEYGAATFTLLAGSTTQATESITAVVTFSNADTGAKVDRCDYQESATFTKL